MLCVRAGGRVRGGGRCVLRECRGNVVTRLGRRVCRAVVIVEVAGEKRGERQGQQRGWREGEAKHTTRRRAQSELWRLGFAGGWRWGLGQCFDTLHSCRGYHITTHKPLVDQTFQCPVQRRAWAMRHLLCPASGQSRTVNGCRQEPGCHGVRVIPATWI